MLQICKELFNQFNKNSVKYVVVKSIERVGPDTSGDSEDIDLLVSSLDKDLSDKILRSIGFKKVLFPKEFDGLGFYIGYDIQTRKQILLHIHNKLRIGNKKYKELHFKIEDYIFENRIFNNDYQLYTTNPQSEFYILLIRTILRKKHKQEDLNRLNSLAKILDLNNDSLINLSTVMLNTPLNFFKDYKYTAKSAYILHKRYSRKVRLYLSGTPLERINVIFRIINGIWTYVLKIILHLLGFPRYIIRTSGKLVAFQGIDGSGKSTQIKHLLETKYLQITGVKRIYGGNNEYWIPGLKGLSKRLSNKTGTMIDLAKSILSVFTIIDRRLRIIPAFLNMRQRKIVVFDRYFYDDLSYNSKAKISKEKIPSIKRFTKKLLMSGLGYTPHLTIFLDIDAKDAYKRKQDYPLEKVEIQVDAYREILRGRKEVEVIDANDSIEAINQSIMKLLITL